jgi:hypothetical protein
MGAAGFEPFCTSDRRRRWQKASAWAWRRFRFPASQRLRACVDSASICEVSSYSPSGSNSNMPPSSWSSTRVWQSRVEWGRKKKRSSDRCGSLSTFAKEPWGPAACLPPARSLLRLLAPPPFICPGTFGERDHLNRSTNGKRDPHPCIGAHAFFTSVLVTATVNFSVLANRLHLLFLEIRWPSSPRNRPPVWFWGSNHQKAYMVSCLVAWLPRPLVSSIDWFSRLSSWLCQYGLLLNLLLHLSTF